MLRMNLFLATGRESSDSSTGTITGRSRWIDSRNLSIIDLGGIEDVAFIFLPPHISPGTYVSSWYFSNDKRKIKLGSIK